jgi:stage V sporulation protein B
MAELHPQVASAERDFQPRLGQSALATTVASGLFVTAGYVINVVLGRALGPTDYGLFGVVIGLLTVINALQMAGIPQAVARLTAQGTEAAPNLLLTGGVLQLGLGLLLSAALYVGAAPLALLFGDDRLDELFRLAAFALPAYALFSLLWGSAGGRGLYLHQAAMLSVNATAKAIFAVGLGLLMSVPGAIIGYLLGPLVGSAAYKFRGLASARWAPPWPMLRLSAPLLLLTTLSMALLYIDLFLVKALVADAAEAGHYTAAQNIARVPYFLLAGFTAMMLPAVARAAESGGDVRQVVHQALRFGLVIIAPFVALLTGAAEETVRLLYGQDYVPAATAVRVLAPATALFALAALLASVLSGLGRAGRASAAIGSGLAVSFCVSIILIPGLGIVGAGLGTLAGSACAVVLLLWAAWHYHAITAPWLSVGRIAVASAVVGVGALLLRGDLTLLIGVPVLGLAYGAVLIALREITAADRRRLLRLSNH